MSLSLVAGPCNRYSGLRFCSAIAQRMFSSQGQLRPKNVKGQLTADIVKELPSTPAMSPSYPKGPYHFHNREYFIVHYESDTEKVLAALPPPLKPIQGPSGTGRALVMYEFIRMPDSTGFGSYEESGVVIPCLLNGERVSFTAQMYLDCEPPIAAGREVWGFPKKYANPKMTVHTDTIYGNLLYSGREVSRATMAYKYERIDLEEAAKTLSKKQLNLKLIASPDFKPSIAQLIGYNLTNINVMEAWKGPASLELFAHANAPVAALPVRRVLGGTHILADITLPYGEVLVDYLKEDENTFKQDDEERIQALLQPGAQDSDVICLPPPLTSSLIRRAKAMPLQAPSYRVQSTTMKNNCYFTLRYKTDTKAVLPYVPDFFSVREEERGLSPVYLRWVNSESVGLGQYSKVEAFVEAYDQKGEPVLVSLLSFVDCSSAITIGREVYGHPRKFGCPSLTTESDTMTGRFTYRSTSTTSTPIGFRSSTYTQEGRQREDDCVAVATMRYKDSPLSHDAAVNYLSLPEISIKMIPDVNGNPAIAELVRIQKQKVIVRGAWKGLARLHLVPHVNAPLADLPVREMGEGFYIECDAEVFEGEKIHDYLAEK